MVIIQKGKVYSWKFKHYVPMSNNPPYITDPVGKKQTQKHEARAARSKGAMSTFQNNILSP